MKEAHRNTVYNRDPTGDDGQPYTFEGQVVAEGDDITDTAKLHTRVYDTFDGYYLIEHSSQPLVEGELPSSRYEIVPAPNVRDAVIMNCDTGVMAFQISE